MGRVKFSTNSRTKDKNTIVDDCIDFKHTFYVNNKGYVITNINRKIVLLHQMIMKMYHIPKQYPDSVIDHINHNRIDNRIENLRYLPRWVNSTLRKNKTETSKYKGVCYVKNRKSSNRWRIQIWINGKRISHYRLTEKLASIHYNELLKQKLNQMNYNQFDIDYFYDLLKN